VLDLISDHYGNMAVRVLMPFPLDAYDAVKGVHTERLRVYGLFVKNYTYTTRRPGEDGGYDLLTVPLFVVLHIESDEDVTSPYRLLIWYLSGAIVLLGILFYVVLVRGEGRERDRMDSRRRDLRRRIRELHPPDFGSPGAAPPTEPPEGT
jgi:hypothetical protein